MKPREAGSDEFGGRYLRCEIGATRVIIRAYPDAKSYGRARYALSMGRWSLTELRNLKGISCAAIFLEGFKYRVELWATSRPLTFAKHGELTESLQSILGIPWRYVADKKTGLKAGTQRLSTTPTGCADFTPTG